MQHPNLRTLGDVRRTHESKDDMARREEIAPAVQQRRCLPRWEKAVCMALRGGPSYFHAWSISTRPSMSYHKSTGH